MSKHYKITYKTYFNDRLKQVSFHGKPTYPLYIQLTYARKTIFFKSAFFELFSQKRYAIRGSDHKQQYPSLSFIAGKEEALIEFIIEKHQGDFSLDQFKEAYKYYSVDLCQSTEEAFRAFMVVFYANKPTSGFGMALAEGSKNYVMYDILQGARLLLTKPAYEELASNFSQAPPYLQLYNFMNALKEWPDKVLTVMEWEHATTRELFSKHLKEHYPALESTEVIAKVENWLHEVRKYLKTV